MMRVLCSTRLLLLLGNSFHSQKFPNAARISRFHSSVHFLRQAKSIHGALTLESLGFKSEFKTTDICQMPDSAVEIPKPIRKAVRSNPTKAISVKNPLEIEAAPFAANSFSELGLNQQLIERLEKEGFTVPTDVQAAAIPVIIKNRDVVIQSYTGSGKTLAYLLPILSELGPFKSMDSGSNGHEPKEKTDIKAVIVAPSRELGMQIVREVEKLLGPANKKLVQQLVGGANIARQDEALKKNMPSIIVGTPGRIANLSLSGKLKTHGCQYLVLDEVDELLSFNFRQDMHRILEHVGKHPRAQGRIDKLAERQTVMVSATVPISVLRAAGSWARDPLLVRAKSVTPLDSIATEPVNLSALSLNSASLGSKQTQAAVESLPPVLRHYYCISRHQHKVDTLRRSIHALDAKFVIAFMNHTKQLKDVVHKLEARGVKAAQLHGDLGKLGRSTTLKKFKNGEVRVLVTNELSARGLDVAECDLVVNLEMPTDSIHYAHRAGRTGRLGRKGNVITICEEREVFVVNKLQRQLGVPIKCCDFIEGKLVIYKNEGKSVEAVN